MDDTPLEIAGRKFNSRLIIGTGKYKDYAENAAAAEAAGAEIITVAVRRVNLTDPNKPMLVDFLDQKKRIKIEALIDTGSGPEQLSPSIYSRVISASVGSGDNKQVLLNIEDYGDIDVSTAVNFR